MNLKSGPLEFTSYKAFLKRKKMELVPLSHFLHNFQRKLIFTCYYLTKFHSQIAFTSWDIGQYVYLSVCALVWKNLKLTYVFLWSHFSTWLKSWDKNLNILRTKRVFKMELRTFFVIFKWYSLKQNNIFSEVGSLTLILVSYIKNELKK